MRQVLLGNEYDNQLLIRLRKVFNELGGKIDEVLDVVAGSQEIREYEVKLRASCVLVSVETYVGVTITGEDEIIDAIVSRMKEEI